ncbi:MAG TPA: AAA family ATPase [bacterium]|nr:AAA family ATPase [bacterium]
MKSQQIYIMGAHSTGKTTLARYISQRWDLPLVTEVARSVLAEKELQLASLRTDLSTVNAYQREVFERQMAAEQAVAHTGFVSDRSFDNIAYAAQYSTITHDLMDSPTMRAYFCSMAGSIIFFIRPHRDLVAHDGTRANVNWEDLVAIDGMVKFLLEMSGLRYIPVASQKMQERVRLVEAVLALADPRFRDAGEQGVIFPEAVPSNGVAEHLKR